MFASNSPPRPESKWGHQLDKFVKENHHDLAALSWGLWLENGRDRGTIGIDLKPQPPRFVYCPDEAVEKLNNNVDNHLQEIIGLINHYQPEIEVLMIAIATDQVKLIYFQPEVTPPQCFEQINKDVDTLLADIENRLAPRITV